MLIYTVTATLPDEATASEYIAWLNDGHVQAVVSGGAASAHVIRVEEPAAPIQVETRYVFASREDHDRYLRDHAPRLRAEGLARFGPGRGIAFQRRLGRVV